MPDHIIHSVSKPVSGWDSRWAVMVGMVSLLMVQWVFTLLVFWCGLNRFQKYNSEA